MSQLSKNLSRAEFACKCGCGFDTVDAELVRVIQDVRDHFGSPVVISSGCRCYEHNKRVRGAARSTHLEGRGADIQVKGKTPKEVYEYLTGKYPNRYGIAWHRSFVHVDTRSNGPARWDY